jgi:hypothetical protein
MAGAMVKETAGRFLTPDMNDNPAELADDYYGLVAMAQDYIDRPHDKAAEDRFMFEVTDLGTKLTQIVTDERHPDFLIATLRLMILDSVRRAAIA